MSFRVVIITCRSGSLRQAEHYLRNRQWDVYSTPSLRDAVSAVIKRRPDFVLIAADHPNRKVRDIPLLIRRALDVKIITFCESSSASAFAALNEMNMGYSVYPPVSGPAIERTVLKIKKEEDYTKENGQPPPAQRSDQSGPAYKTIEGSRDQGSMPTGPIIIKKDAEAAGGVYINKNQGSSPGSNYRSSGESFGGGGFVPGGGSTSQGGGFVPGNGSATESGGFIPGGGRPSQGGGFAPGNESTAKGGMIHPNGSGENGSADRAAWTSNDGEGSERQNGSPHEGDPSGVNHGSQDPDGEPGPSSFSDPYSSNWDADQRNEYEEQRAKRKGPTYEGGGRVLKPATPKFGDTPSGNKEDDPIVLESRHIPKKPKGLPRYRQDPSQYPDKDSIMVRGTQQALEEAAVIGDLTEYEELQKSTNVACIIVESPRFSGYLVAAMGKDRQIDQKFTDTVKEKLFDFLRAHGETVNDDESMNLTLEQVEFEEWAIQQAHFLRKAIHGSQEVAIAFFPTKETSIRLEESVSKNMLKMNLDELRDDVPVEFDIYMYMPSNNRFLLYTPEGRPIYGSQRGRLREKGVTHIHLRKENSSQVKKYRAQVFLNDKIAEFRTKQSKSA